MKREMKHVKKFGVILLLNKMKSGAKRVVFCSYRCFLESEQLRCEKKFCKRSNFLFTCGILKQFFNSRTAIAGAIIGLLLVFFYFVVMIFVTNI